MTVMASKTRDLAAPVAELHTSCGVLLEALTALSVGAAAKSAMPILAGVLLDWSGGSEPMLSSFNFDSACRVALKSEHATGAGRAVVDHAETTKVVKAMVKGLRKSQYATLPVTVALSSGGAVSVEVNNMAMPLRTMPPEDFPALPVTKRPFAVVDRNELAALVTRVGIAASTDKKLMVLTGAHLTSAQGRIRLACCDRYRIACGTLQPYEAVPQDIDVIVPLSLLTAATKHLPAGDVGLYFDADSPTRIALATVPGAAGPAIEVSASLLDSNYPPVENQRERMANDSNGTVVELDREIALQAVRQASAVLRAKGGSGVVLEPVADNEVQIRPDISAVCTMPTIPARYTAGTPFPAALFNGAFLGEALAAFTGKTITMKISAGFKPALLVDDVKSLTEPLQPWHLLMPARRAA